MTRATTKPKRHPRSTDSSQSVTDTERARKTTTLMPCKPRTVTQEHRARLTEARQAAQEAQAAMRAATRIELNDLVMYRLDDLNWVVNNRAGTDPHYFSEPVHAALDMLRRTTDRHICARKARTIADVMAGYEKATAEVVAAMKKIERRML